MRKLIATKFQEQFWILNQLSKNNTTYNIPVVFKLSVLPDIQKFEKVVEVLIHKYDVLFSEYSLENGRVMICFPENSNYRFEISVESNKTKKASGRLTSEIFGEIHKPFDLSKAPLFRIKLFEYSDAIYITFVFHHIIIDLRSKEIFFKDLENLYNSSITEDNSLIFGSTKQYSAFAQEHNDWLKSTEAEQIMKTWKDELPPINHLLNLPINKPRLKTINFEGKRNYFTLNSENWKRIKSFSSELEINSFIFCLSAYFILLHKIAQQDRIVIGVPLSNRRNHSNNEVFGCFVNILPIDISFNDDSCINDIIRQVRNKLLLAHRKQEVPFLALIEQEKENRNLAYNPYFQTGFTFEPLAQININNITAQPIPIEKNGAQLDLFLTMWESDAGFEGYIEYSTQLFSDSMAKRIELLYKKIVVEILNNKKLVSEISILPNEDKTILQAWNNTHADINVNKCLHQQFEEQVVATPDEIALKYNGNSLTYEQVNKHANRLSNYLIKRGVQVEDIVGISMDRSFELIISIIAIHKAGAAYLPLDAKYPKERIEAIIEDGKPKLIITTTANLKILDGHNNVVLIDQIFSDPLSNNDSNPNLDINSQSLAYLLFTSGSTGRPKGVMIEHHSVINKLVWMQTMHPIYKGDSLLLKTPVTFDVSVWELFWWFFNGSCLTILPPEGEKFPELIIETTAKNNVNTLIFVPSMFAPFVDYVKSKDLVSKLHSLKYIILIGEALSPKLVMDFNNLRTSHFSPRLVNTYGPTEATVAVSYYNCPEKNSVDRIFIGKPIYNTKLFIIDKNNHICPIGVPGELVISGENLARGYKNSPELNKTKFLEIKDLNDNSLKVYKTGDIARWDESGELDFNGRVDNQVKIRGYRIELGDIETKLLGNEKIETAVVIVNTISDGNAQLVAYVVLKDGLDSNSSEIRNFLKLILPEYMIPAHIVILDSMPLNSSEKIDRKALPKPQIEMDKVVLNPVSDTEKIILGIWKDLLHFDQISITSNFFDIGGNSLLVISMVAHIKRELNIDIEPVALMQYTNIRDLSQYLDNIHTIEGQNESYLDIKEKALLRKDRFSSRKRML